MARIAVYLFLLFAVLLVLRALRVLLAGFLRGRVGRPASRDSEQEMVRDPVCGTWIDRRLAIAGRRGADWVPVCSEKCRTLLEAPAGRS